MIYQVFRPAPAIADYVECFWYLRKDPTAMPEIDRVLPDGCMEMIFHRRTPFSHADRDGRFVRQSPALLVGQLSRFLLLQSARDAEVIAVRFRPAGVRAFFAIDLDELVDR